MRILEPTILCPGLSARPTSTGFVAVDLGYTADEIAFTPEIIASERARLPGWRWRKEYERDFSAQSGQPFFSPEAIDAQRQNLRNPVGLYDIRNGQLAPVPGIGRVRVYHLPTEQPQDLPPGSERVDMAFGIGMDVAEGVGKSDSAIEVFSVLGRVQFAELTDSHISPPDLGRLAVALAEFYHDALICCVRKMHGITTLRTMIDERHYPHLWHHRISSGIVERSASALGWAKGESSDELLFGRYKDAFDSGRVTVRSQLLLDQHRQYQFSESGEVIHSATAGMSIVERQRHGDACVASALAHRACMDLPVYRNVHAKRRTPAQRYLEDRARLAASPWHRRTQ